MQELTYEFLNEILEYAPETGKFFWKKPVAKRIKPGQKAGSMTPTGYMKVSINNKNRLLHRIAICMSTGEMPAETMMVDHINGDKADNRLSNLRVVTRSVNNRNIAPRNGTAGTNLHRSGRWVAQMRLNGKTKHIGCYSTQAEAHEAYKKARIAYGFEPLRSES